MTSAARRPWFPAAALLLGLAAAAAVGEVAVRLLDPSPRTQIVRPHPERTLAVVDGVPLWRHAEPAWQALWGEDCVMPADGHVVSLVGDSILQVTETTPDVNVAVPLAATLGPSWCVRNVAQAGFVAEQKAVLAHDQLTRHHPDVLVWGVWGERGHVVDLGGSYYGVGGYETDDDGFPVWPSVPVPAALHHALFLHSRLYAYAVLTLAPTERFDDVLPLFDGVLAHARETGTTLLLVVLPELERPFGEPPVVVDVVQQRVRAWAAEHHVPLVDVGQAWAGRLDHEAVRLDACCHYNAAGHAALAELLAPAIEELARP